MIPPSHVPFSWTFRKSSVCFWAGGPGSSGGPSGLHSSELQGLNLHFSKRLENITQEMEIITISQDPFTLDFKHIWGYSLHHQQTVTHKISFLPAETYRKRLSRRENEWWVLWGIYWSYSLTMKNGDFFINLLSTIAFSWKLKKINKQTKIPLPCTLCSQMHYRAWHDCLFTKQELGVFKISLLFSSTYI